MGYKRNILVVDKEFQMKLCFLVCSLVFIGSLVYFIALDDLFDKVIEINVDLTDQFMDAKIKLMMILGVIQLAYLGVVFGVSLILSHRIAGPLYKLRMYLEDVRSGGSFKKLTFRDKDFFQNIAAETTETIEYLTHKSEDEADYLDEVSTYLENIALVVPEDKKPVLNEIQTKLKEINNLREGF